MEDHQDQKEPSETGAVHGDTPADGRNGRFSISPRLTYLLIGGAALGLIGLMCLVVALIAVFQNS